MTNYLHRVPNPFSLSAPPAWFLAELCAYDADLVVFPSQEERVYRFARKAKVHPAVLTALRNRPDTKTYWEYRLVPVTSLPQFEPWRPQIIWELAERDIQRVGGADAAADRLDAYDERVEVQVRAQTADGLDARAHDAYIDATLDLGMRNNRKTRGGLVHADGPRRPVRRPTHWHGDSGAVFAR